MFSDSAYKNADACRFCWMCRHLCPVSLKTGKEINGARAKGLMISMVRRGEQYDPTMAAAMWECCLCGACTNDCASGYDPRIFIREARSLALAEGLAPDSVVRVADRMMEDGIMDENREIPSALQDRIFRLPAQADTLVVLGQIALYKYPELANSFLDVLDRAGIRYTVMNPEPDTGAYLGDMVGFVDEVRQLARIFAGTVNSTGAKTIVTLDPMDARMLKHEYATWNCAPDAEVTTATAFVAGLVRHGLLKLKPAGERGSVSVHDSGALCRDLNETQPVRDILTALNMDVREMFRHKDLAKSSGGALFAEYAPELSKLVAGGRWEDFLRTGAGALVTEAPGSFLALNRCVPEGCTLVDLFSLLAQHC